MAAAPDPLIAWLLDELQPLAAQIGEIRARRMFGGAGLYHDDIVFGLVANGTCYLRIDDTTRARFAAVGSTPFGYDRDGRTITMSGYLSTPAEALGGVARGQWWQQAAPNVEVGERLEGAVRWRRGEGQLEFHAHALDGSLGKTGRRLAGRRHGLALDRESMEGGSKPRQPQDSKSVALEAVELGRFQPATFEIVESTKGIFERPFE